MRVLAAAFEELGAATSALEELRDRYGLRATDAGIAPLASGDPSGGQTLLAGRFYDDAVPAIRAVVAEHGGEVVSEVDESWTHSPSAHESLESESDNLTN
jgi:hypothetical protein